MSQQLASLRARIQQLEFELQEFKSGRTVVSEDGSVVINDMASEITMLRTENDKYVLCMCIHNMKVRMYINELHVWGQA